MAIQYYIQKGEGMNGAPSHRVRSVQELLFQLGYLKTNPDGKFWDNTENAVMKAQKSYGIDETGIVDLVFFNCLCEEAILTNPKKK